MEITTEMIKKLRAATSAPMLDCRKALQDADGDFNKAVDWLREKGMATAAKRADRDASNGVVEMYSHGGGRVAHEIALQIAAGAPKYVKAEDIPASELEHEANIARARAKEEGKPANVMDKIVEGRVEKFTDEVCLMRQTYIRDENLNIEKLILQNIAAIGESVVVRRFQRWELGESTANQ